MAAHFLKAQFSSKNSFMFETPKEIPKKLITAMKILVASIIILMAFGAFVRTMNAGLTCPDWPLCFGKVIPEYHFGVYLEFIHRAYAGLETILFVFCLFSILRNPLISKSTKRMSLVGLFFLISQIVMGGLTVLLLLKSVIVTSHLALAALFMASIWWTTLKLQDEREKPPVEISISKKFPYYFICVLPVLIFIQLLLGGLVASTYSGLVCLDFPKCNGMWVPSLEGTLGLQVIHRFWAYFIALSIFAIRIWASFDEKTKKLNPKIFFNAKILFMFVVLQIFWGVVNLKYYLPAWGAVLHHLTGVILFALSLRFVYLVRKISV
jgi:cytochrome c oxidase assembly protein subunit 15